MKSNDILRYLDKYLFGFVALTLGVFVYVFSSKKRTLSDNSHLLIIKLWAVGDSVNSLPMIHVLRKLYPAATIDVCARAANAKVYEGQPFIDTIILFELFNISSIMRMFKKYDFVIDTEPFLNISALLAWYMGKTRIGFAGKTRSMFYQYRAIFRKDQHIVKTYFDMISSLDSRTSQYIPESLIPLAYSKKANREVDSILSKNHISRHATLIGFCASVGAEVKEREWPKEKFRLLAKKIIRHKNTSIILVGLKDDWAMNEYIKDGDSQIINLSGQLSLEGLFFITEKLEIFVSNDTGPMHIAAAQGTKTIGLFGPNTPKIWSPYGKNRNGSNNVAIFHPKKGCPFLDNTSHTLVPKHLTKDQRTCMDAITVDEVYAEIIKSRRNANKNRKRKQ
jgi:heptosyltransferase-2